MVKLARIVGLVAALCALTAAPAHANFFPDLTVSLDPPTAGSTPPLTAVITQPASDTAIKRFTLNFASGFHAVGAPAAAGCSLEDLFAAACPASTRIGTVDGRVGDAVALTGTIHKATGDRFVLLVTALGGSIAQAVPGSLIARSNGSLDLTIDQLPALPLTNLTLRFDGGPRALIETPSQCGDYVIDGKFTSRLDEMALDRTTVAVAGCHGVPAVRVENLRLSRTRFAPGGYRTVIAWWASRAVDHTLVRIQRHKRGHWNVIGSFFADAAQGENFVRWDGRLSGRALRPGPYGVSIQPAGSAPSKVARFRVVER